MLASLSPDAHSPLIGYAAAGFPIYALYGYSDPKEPTKGIKQIRSSWRLKSGTRPDGPGGRYDGTFINDWQYVDGAGDLNESNARFTVTPEYPKGTFAYLLSDGFPFVPRSFVGTLDSSFRKGPPGGGADMVEADTAARLSKDGDKALRPLHLGRQRHQDRIHVAAGLETENRATIM